MVCQLFVSCRLLLVRVREQKKTGWMLIGPDPLRTQYETSRSRPKTSVRISRALYSSSLIVNIVPNSLKPSDSDTWPNAIGFRTAICHRSNTTRLGVLSFSLRKLELEDDEIYV